MTLRDHLRSWREARGWTIYQAGSALGVSGYHIYAVEAGIETPRDDLILRLKLADLLDLAV